MGAIGTAASDSYAATKRLGPARRVASPFSRRPAWADPIDEGKIMGSLSKMTATKPLTDRQPMCDKNILRLLADQHGHTVAEMVAHFRVSRTNIQARLYRLTAAQSLTRKLDDELQRGRGRGRGRPKCLYFITSKGEAALVEAADEGVASQKSRPRPVRAFHENTAGGTEGKITRSVLKKAATKPPTDQQRKIDNDILRLLADRRGRSILDMAEYFAVTKPTIRKRLFRLMLAQKVNRKRDDMTLKRGKISFLYYITRRGAAALAKAADEGVALRESRPWPVWGWR